MAKPHSPRFLALVEEAKERIREISPEEMMRKLETESGFHLVDVREAEEFAAGRLPRAKHLCKGIIERDIEAAGPDLGAEILLYCGGGFRSALSADNLQKMGYTRVLPLASGWREWSRA